MAGSTATCTGAPDCNIKGGCLGVSLGTSFTENFDISGVPSYFYSSSQADCSKDGLFTWQDGSSRTGGTPMSAEMGGVTFTPVIHSYGEGINIALNNPTVVLNAGGNPDAAFIFHAGTTLTTCANSRIELQGGAKVENAFWVPGTAVTMGANSTLVGTVLVGSAITMGTNGEIVGRAVAQIAVTCEIACTVDSRKLNSAQPSSEPSAMTTSKPSDENGGLPLSEPLAMTTSKPSNESGDNQNGGNQNGASGDDFNVRFNKIEFPNLQTPDFMPLQRNNYPVLGPISKSLKHDVMAVSVVTANDPELYGGDAQYFINAVGGPPSMPNSDSNHPFWEDF
jgi:hypothetical protein